MAIRIRFIKHLFTALVALPVAVPILLPLISDSAQAQLCPNKVLGPETWQTNWCKCIPAAGATQTGEHIIVQPKADCEAEGGEALCPCDDDVSWNECRNAVCEAALMLLTNKLEVDYYSQLENPYEAVGFDLLEPPACDRGCIDRGVTTVLNDNAFTAGGKTILPGDECSAKVVRKCAPPPTAKAKSTNTPVPNKKQQ